MMVEFSVKKIDGCLHLEVRLVVDLSVSLMSTFALWVTSDRQQPCLEPLSLHSLLTIIVLLRHKPASERYMGCCGCVFARERERECVFIYVRVCLCTQARLPFKANGARVFSF